MYNMFRMSGMDPGKEFKVGIEESDRIGATLVLGDRSQELTIKALRDALSLPDILRMITGGGSMQWDGVDPRLVDRFKRVDWNDPESAVELLKTREAVRALTGQMRREFPKVASAMLDQRDDLMTDNLLNKCKGRTVAVVGMAHMDGIESRWRDKVGIEESDRIGATLVLGDRSQELTIKALRDALSLPDILRMITGGGSMQWDGVDPRLVDRFKRVDWNDPESAVELLKTREAVRALTGQMRREFPKVASAMLDQRDDLMTDNLLNKCKGRTVAVVGMAHMDGIESRWRDAMGGDGGVTLIS